MLWGGLLCGQTVIAPVVEGGASVPAPPCVTGQVYFNTGAAAGQNLYVCASNTWTQINGAAANGVSTNASNTYAAGTVQSFLGTLDASGAAATLPAQTGATLPATCSTGQLFLKTGSDPSRMLYICSAANNWSQAGFAQGTTAQMPASCAVGQMYFATDAAAGNNLYFCTSSNTWTQMAGAALPTQTGYAGNFLTTNGTTASWGGITAGTVSAGGIYYSSTMLADNNVYMIFSVDGITWNFVTRGAVYNFQSPDLCARDPDISEINGSYWMVFNNCHTAAPSITLINAPRPGGPWALVGRVDLSSVGATAYAYTPRWVEDADLSWHVIVPVSPTDQDHFQLYEVHPTDTSGLTTWSAPVLVTGTSLDPNTIDVHPMIPSTVTAGPCSGKYVMFYEEKNQGKIRYMCSTSFLTGYTVQDTDVAALWTGGHPHEGPTMIQVNATTWRLYYDLMADTSWHYVETTNWTSWGAPVDLTQLNGPTVANIGVLYPKPRRTYDFATLASILASVGTSMWSVPTLTGANANNQIAYFAAGGATLTSDSSNLAYSGGGMYSDGFSSGGPMQAGGPLLWRWRDNPSCAGGTVAPSGGYGYHRIALTDTASCSITLPTNTDMTQVQVILCNGASSATTSLTWANATGGMAAGGTTSQCAAQTFLYDSTKARWYAVGGGSGWY
jgi:hypothetical protein